MPRTGTALLQTFDRLNFKSYIQVIKNSIGSKMFRNLYVRSPEKNEFDAMGDGANSCAFYVSSVLLLFGKASAVHGTIERTLEDMTQSGWAKVNTPKIGDVLLWESKDFKDGPHRHIGFYIGGGKAVSNSSTQKAPAMHDKHFGQEKRKIEASYRMYHWDD